MSYELTYKQYSERAILMEWPPEISENILEDILLLKKGLWQKSDKVIVQITSTYNSILIFYVSTIKDFYSEVLSLKSIYRELNKADDIKKKVWEIPVCYDIVLAPDLKDFAHQKNISIEEIIALHTAPLYRVFFIGFLPGFMYLGGLDKRLHFPRKATPSLDVKKGAVAIGGEQTGIYPMDSPGGWHVIGHSPLNFFNINEQNPCYSNSGDYIKFIDISIDYYNDISLEIVADNYVYKSYFVE